MCAPVAVDDGEIVDEGFDVNIDLVANDTDADGDLDPASITIVVPPINGSVAVNAHGTVDYTHAGTETSDDLD
jgi:hypothetical protein